jgi:hypothetical protein
LLKHRSLQEYIHDGIGKKAIAGAGSLLRNDCKALCKELKEIGSKPVPQLAELRVTQTCISQVSLARLEGAMPGCGSLPEVVCVTRVL